MKKEYIKPTVEALNILNIVPVCTSQGVSVNGAASDITFEGEATTDIGGDVKGETFWD